MGQFDISYRPGIVIKCQALADFIVEFTYSNAIEVAGTTDIAKAAKEVEMEKNKTTAKKLKDGDLHGEQWILYVDGASNENGS